MSVMVDSAFANRTEAHLVRMEATQRVLGNPRKSLAAHVKADSEFHAILAEATGNRFLPLVLLPAKCVMIIRADGMPTYCWQDMMCRYTLPHS